MRTHKNIIVTLQYNKFELTKRMIEGLLSHEYKNIDKILVVDNGSDVKVGKNLIAFRQSNSGDINAFSIDCKMIDRNIGFTLGANYGILSAQELGDEGNLIFLISNDVEINGKFIEQAEDILLGAKRSLVGNRHINWNSGWNTFDGKTFDYLEGYFLATTHFGWFDLGYFDPNYAPCDFEDVDLTTKAKQKGYKIVSLNNPNIVHAGAGTYGYNPKREAITRRNQEYFKNKWTK